MDGLLAAARLESAVGTTIVLAGPQPSAARASCGGPPARSAAEPGSCVPSTPRSGRQPFSKPCSTAEDPAPAAPQTPHFIFRKSFASRGRSSQDSRLRAEGDLETASRPPPVVRSEGLLPGASHAAIAARSLRWTRRRRRVSISRPRSSPSTPSGKRPRTSRRATTPSASSTGGIICPDSPRIAPHRSWS